MKVDICIKGYVSEGDKTFYTLETSHPLEQFVKETINNQGLWIQQPIYKFEGYDNILDQPKYKRTGQYYEKWIPYHQIQFIAPNLSELGENNEHEGDHTP